MDRKHKSNSNLNLNVWKILGAAHHIFTSMRDIHIIKKSLTLYTHTHTHIQAPIICIRNFHSLCPYATIINHRYQLYHFNHSQIRSDLSPVQSSRRKRPRTSDQRPKDHPKFSVCGEDWCFACNAIKRRRSPILYYTPRPYPAIIKNMTDPCKCLIVLFWQLQILNAKKTNPFRLCVMPCRKNQVE
ncbi:hypothetical protein EYC84_005735 [Monilinia fructicola]|uniref:Uncharacterized protein n=1 Tax=Monilinia fructicola TaxID=38448 RepID=A0A5M9K009_MONFR|nr:hypothetical protein EYC84_005735 [Monilinia fructicola]